MNLKNGNYQNFPENFPMNFSGKFTAKVVMKNDYVRADGTCALYIQIFLNKEKKKLPLQISVRKCDFDEVKQRVKSKVVFGNDYNLLIEKALSSLHQIEINYRLSNVPLTIENLIKDYTNPTSRIDFIQFWENEMENQKFILKKGTYRQQLSILNKVKNYKSKILFYEIDNDFFEKMKLYFKRVKKNGDSTIGSLVKSFKKYLHIANKKGIMTSLNYSDIKNKSFAGNRTYLSTTEIEKLHDYYLAPFINDNHKSILSQFLFSCFTGLRISDNQKINLDNIIEETLVFVSTKSEKFQRIPLNKTAKSFIGEKVLFEKNFTPEYINRELKDICKIVGIRKLVTFHVARHTFATNFLICGGRVEVLQKLLGHSNIKDTMVYVHIVESVTDIQINNMDDILRKKNNG